MSDMSSDKVSQIDRLAAYIMEEIDGEPSGNEGAGDCAIRLLKALESANAALKEQLEKAEAWNHAVPVCREHALELVTIGGCVVCTNAALRTALESQAAELGRVEGQRDALRQQAASDKEHKQWCHTRIKELEAERDALRQQPAEANTRAEKAEGLLRKSLAGLMVFAPSSHPLAGTIRAHLAAHKPDDEVPR